MKVITIKFDNAGEWHFLFELMKRLHIHFEWKEEPIAAVKNGAKPVSDVVATLFGSFPSDKNSDEFVQSLYEARINQTREINL